MKTLGERTLVELFDLGVEEIQLTPDPWIKNVKSFTIRKEDIDFNKDCKFGEFRHFTLNHFCHRFACGYRCV